MNEQDEKQLHQRLCRLEDESEIRRVLMSYGPAADAGLASFAASRWLEDGVYDWDAHGEPHHGCSAVGDMLRSDGHQGLITHGVAHFAGPVLVEVDGDRATALNYSLIMRREEDRFFLWRVSAVRWDVERAGSSWRVRRRTNRVLDSAGGGRQFFADALHELFGEDAR
jgi:hypothetical protein